MEDTPEAISAHIRSLRRYAMALVRNPTEAEDLVQECLCRTLERARHWDKINDLRSYLFTALHNLYVDQIAKKRGRFVSVPDEVLERKLVAAPCQLDRLALGDLSRAIDRLPPEQREVLLLVGLEGMTYEATARITDTPLGTVMSRLSRARETLRGALKGETSAARNGGMEELNGRKPLNGHKPADFLVESAARGRG